MTALLDKVDSLHPLWGIAIAAGVIVLFALAFTVLAVIVYASRMSKTEKQAFGIDPEDLDLCDSKPKRKRPLTEQEIKDLEDEASDMIGMQGSHF